MHIEFGILGPLEVKVDGKSVKLGGRGERALLGTLLLNAGETVPLERLVDDLWGEAPPASARHLIQVYVSRLRRGLEEPSVITTRARPEPSAVVATVAANMTMSKGANTNRRTSRFTVARAARKGIRKAHFMFSSFGRSIEAARLVWTCVAK